MDYITILHIFEMKPTGTSETLAQLRRGFSKRFLRGFRFLNVVLLKRARTSKRFLKGSRSPEVFQRFSGCFWSTFFVYFRCYSARKKKTKNRNLRVRTFVCVDLNFSISSNCLFHPYSMTKTKITNPPFYVIWSRIIYRSL